MDSLGVTSGEKKTSSTQICSVWDWRENSVAKVLATQAREPEAEAQHHIVLGGMVNPLLIPVLRQGPQEQAG